MLRSVLIDDEVKARENLTGILNEYCDNVEVLAKEGNVKDGLKAIKDNKPDLVFLDIKMQKETGFDLLSQLPEIDFDIIFVTAHDKFAVKAFKFAAIDYLLKPINISELQDAVERVRERKSMQNTRLGYQILKENLTKQNAGEKKIAIPTSEGLIFVRVNQIVRCEADGSYTTVHLVEDDRITVSKILKEFDELLRDYNFVRIHQSHLINMEYLKKYISAKGGCVVMQDESMVSVSRNYKEAFLSRLASI